MNLEEIKEDIKNDILISERRFSQLCDQASEEKIRLDTLCKQLVCEHEWEEACSRTMLWDEILKCKKCGRVHAE